MTISERPSNPPTAKARLIKDWLVKFSLNCNEPLGEIASRGYQHMWEEVFAHVDYSSLKTAFAKTLRTCKFFPRVADVLEHLDHAKDNEAEEGAALKWDEVRRNIRLHYHPDLGHWHGSKISDRTQQAINAAGGLPHISECEPKDLVFARQRFIEAYLRWGELEQDQYLLPDGEVKNLLAGLAQAKTLQHLEGRGDSDAGRGPTGPKRRDR
jgi:hypothetical protein